MRMVLLSAMVFDDDHDEDMHANDVEDENDAVDDDDGVVDYDVGWRCRRR